MQKIDNDIFYDYIKQYDPDSKYHLVGEVDYHLLSDDKPYEGMKSHREALRFVFDWLVKQSLENKENARKMFGDELRSVIMATSFTMPNGYQTTKTLELRFLTGMH